MLTAWLAHTHTRTPALIPDTLLQPVASTDDNTIQTPGGGGGDFRFWLLARTLLLIKTRPRVPVLPEHLIC